MRLLLTGLALLSCLSTAHAGPWDDSPFTENSTDSSTESRWPAETKTTRTTIQSTDSSLPSLKIIPAEDLWQRIRNGFAITDLDDPLVQENAEWYASRPEYTQRMLERSKRYLHFVVEEVEKRGMPMEIALLPMIESAYNPTAYSRSHASGIWQFIPSTGKHFGLEQSWWYDGRRDIVAATRAALDYLERLHGMFGSWDLALAAYNWGEGSVSRAQAKNAARGLPTDYLSLTMPAETRNYVPRLLAVKQLIATPGSYGLNLPKVENSPYLAHIRTDKHMDVKLAAKLADMPIEEFLHLNPAYNRPVMARNGACNLLLPVDKVESFQANLAQYDKPLLSWQAYNARRGDKPDQIARKFGISVAELKQHNTLQLNRRNRLASDSTLLVPLQNAGSSNTDTVALAEISPTEPERQNNGRSSENKNRIYVVKAGDTLFSIARRHDMTVDELKRSNKLRSNTVARGQKLSVSGENDSAEPARQLASSETKSAKAKSAKKQASKRTYTVRRGDTLYSIAQRFDVSVTELARWNNLRGKAGSLKPGQRVVVSEA